MKKREVPKWLRWASLGVVILTFIAIRSDYKDCRRWFSLGVYGETTWAEVLNGRLFVWAIWCIIGAVNLYRFIVLTWNKNNDKNICLADNIFSLVILLVWACFPLAAPIHSFYQGIWVMALVVLFVVVGRSWVTSYLE